MPLRAPLPLSKEESEGTGKRWVYESFRRLQAAINQQSIALAAIDRGEAPFGGGFPLVTSHHNLLDLTNYDDHSQYLYMFGRTGGQTVLGDPKISAVGTDVGLTFRAFNGDPNSLSSTLATAQISILDQNVKISAPGTLSLVTQSGDTKGLVFSTGGANFVNAQLDGTLKVRSASAILLPVFEVDTARGVTVGSGKDDSAFSRLDTVTTGNFVIFRQMTLIGASIVTLSSIRKSDGAWVGPVVASGTDTHIDNVFQIIDNVTPSKILMFEVGGVIGTRTWTAQDASGTVPLLEAAQSWSNINIFFPPTSSSSPVIIRGLSGQSGLLFRIQDNLVNDVFIVSPTGSVIANGNFTTLGTNAQFGTTGASGPNYTMNIGPSNASVNIAEVIISSGSAPGGTSKIQLRRGGTVNSQWLVDGTNTIFDFTGKMQFRQVAGSNVVFEFDPVSSGIFKVTGIIEAHNAAAYRYRGDFNPTGTDLVIFAYDDTGLVPLPVSIGTNRIFSITETGTAYFGVAGQNQTVTIGQGGTGTDFAQLRIQSGNSGTTSPRFYLNRNGTDVLSLIYDGDSYFDFAGDLVIRSNMGAGGDRIRIANANHMIFLAPATKSILLRTGGGAFELNLDQNGTLDLTYVPLLKLAAGTTASAPLLFVSGTNKITPAPGAMEFDGTKLYFTFVNRQEFAFRDQNNTWLGSNLFFDSIFSLADDGDSTKILKFQLSGLSTATTRVLTAPDVDGTIWALDPTVGTLDSLGNITLNSSTLTIAGINTATINSSNFFDTGSELNLGIGGGPIRIGDTAVGNARLDIKAGTTSTGTAPIKLNSGPVNTTPLLGAMEFQTDNLFFVISTGTARKRILMADPVGGLTSGRVPFATTNGRLTDDADMTFAVDTLTITKIAATQLTGTLTFADAINIVLNATTGTKIATAANQKLGLWNAAPIVQPALGGAASVFVTNTSLIANDTATFDGYTIGQVVKALRNMGALA